MQEDNHISVAAIAFGVTVGILIAWYLRAAWQAFSKGESLGPWIRDFGWLLFLAWLAWMGIRILSFQVFGIRI